MPPVGFEPTISAGERQQTYAHDLVREAIGSGVWTVISVRNVISTSSHLPPPNANQFVARFEPLAFNEAAWGRDLLFLFHILCETSLLFIHLWIYFILEPGKLSRYSYSLRAGRPGDQIPVGARFSTSIQTGPGAHPVSCNNNNNNYYYYYYYYYIFIYCNWVVTRWQWLFYM